MIALLRASLTERVSAMRVNPLRTALSPLGVVMGSGGDRDARLADGFEGYFQP